MILEMADLSTPPELIVTTSSKTVRELCSRHPGRPVCRREGLATSLATIAPPPSLAAFVKGVTDDIAQADSPMLGAIFVRAGEFIDVVLPAHTC